MPEEAILEQDAFYIITTSSLAEGRSQVLKHNDTFAVFDRHGDIGAAVTGVQGIYHKETRFLSRLVLRVAGMRPMLLGSAVKQDNRLLAVDLTNPDIFDGGEAVLQRGTLHISRVKFLWNGACYERLGLTSYGSSVFRTTVSLRLESDFADVFEVRGTLRQRHGTSLDPEIGEDTLTLGYRGLDDLVRTLNVSLAPVPSRITANEIQFEVALQPKQQELLYVTFACAEEGGEHIGSYEKAYSESMQAFRSSHANACHIYTSNEQFNDWLNRSRDDLDMLLSHTDYGIYPYAGVPWYSTVFGRDGIISALQVLWMAPTIAKGVLNYLAAHQATEVIPEADAEPGKILHEVRQGEMARLKEIPFGLYYGSVDSTPLFILLAGAYYERTADLDFIRRIWPNLLAAMNWIDEYGDVDDDGFVEYARQSSHGLLQQGWKDSSDSIFHADGSPAEAPIALCEVQGYVYAARRAGSKLARALGQPELAQKFERQADDLKTQFQQRFWCDEIGTYALALDGSKRACRVRASNAGHSLFTEIASPDHASRLSRSFLEEDLFSGWGIRTLSCREHRYSPMSYHNGSVWPHDNSLIAAGMSCYGMTDAAARIMTGLFDASIFLELHRQPELFCGFSRRAGEGPVLYPVACAPQAWAAGAVFMLLGAALGLRISGVERQIRFSNAHLPEAIRDVQIKNLHVGDAVVDLALHRNQNDVSVNLLRRQGQVEIVSVS